MTEITSECVTTVDLEDEEAIKARLTEIQTELDDIGNTFGMNRRRFDLNREKDELLDALIRIFQAAR